MLERTTVGSTLPQSQEDAAECGEAAAKVEVEAGGRIEQIEQAVSSVSCRVSSTVVELGSVEQRCLVHHERSMSSYKSISDNSLGLVSQRLSSPQQSCRTPRSSTAILAPTSRYVHGHGHAHAHGRAHDDARAHARAHAQAHAHAHAHGHGHAHAHAPADPYPAA